MAPRPPTARMVDALRNGAAHPRGIISPSEFAASTLQGLVDRDLADWGSGLGLHGINAYMAFITDAGRAYLLTLAAEQPGTDTVRSAARAAINRAVRERVITRRTAEEYLRTGVARAVAELADAPRHGAAAERLAEHIDAKRTYYELRYQNAANPFARQVAAASLMNAQVLTAIWQAMRDDYARSDAVRPDAPTDAAVPPLSD
jgi:hypothetical protein